MLAVPMWAWVVTLAAIAALVAVDIWHSRRPHAVTFREAVTWSVLYVVAAAVFGIALAVAGDGTASAQFFAGYIVERSLSFDNLFVFAIILAQFAVPTRHQQRVLLIGVIGALALRAVFIAAGAAAVQRLSVTFLVFGAFLVYTAIRLVTSDGEPSGDVANNRAVRLFRRIMPVAEGSRDGALFTRVNGRRAATPLLVVVIAILSADILFALDSIPAIFGITSNTYLVFTANAFAVLGLRPLYFLLIGLLDRLVYLNQGLAIVLGFIGVKLVLHYAHTLSPDVPEISTTLSLIIVVGVLAATTIISLLWPRKSTPTGASPTASVVLDPALAAATSGALRPAAEELAARPLHQQDDDGDVDQTGDQRQQSAARRTGLRQ